MVPPKTNTAEQLLPAPARGGTQQEINVRMVTTVIDDLLQRGAISQRQVQLIRADVERRGLDLLPTVLKDQSVSETSAAEVYAKIKGWKVYAADGTEPVVLKSSTDYVITHDGVLYVLNPFDLRRIQNIVSLLEAKAIRGYGVITSSQLMTIKVRSGEEATTKVMVGNDAERQFKAIVEKAIELRSSDIHIMPQGQDVLVLLRRDGKLIPEIRLGYESYEGLSNLILQRAKQETGKVLAPVNGQFSHDYQKVRNIDVRMAVLPATVKGQIEKRFTLRLLGLEVDLLDLEKLGFSESKTNDQVRLLRQMIGQPNGIVLVTGKTGSGKTTTLLATLQWKKKQDPETAIYTLEDPVEKEIPGVTHIGCNASTGGAMTFQAGLKALLRHDPDVVMVGEIRDKEVADLAIEASMTGQLVLSTLHTNSAPESINRLRMMGVNSTMLADALNGVVAQRVVPKVCKHCGIKARLADLVEGKHDLFKKGGDYGLMLRETYAQAPERLAGIPEGPSMDDEVLMIDPTACGKCKSGTSGRHIMAEVLVANEEIKDLILEGAHSGRILDAALADNFRPMPHHGMELVKKQVLAYESVSRLMSRITKSNPAPAKESAHA